MKKHLHFYTDLAQDSFPGICFPFSFRFEYFQFYQRFAVKFALDFFFQEKIDETVNIPLFSEQKLKNTLFTRMRKTINASRKYLCL